MNNQALAELLFPHVTRTPEDVEAIFPPRNLPEGAKVTRLAPSPTGFMHFGTLFPALVNERLATQSGGVFYLRIEDTDAKREVAGAEQNLIDTLAYYQVYFNEGATADGARGAYGPYRQSERVDIYHVFAKKLVAEGKAYPCFCTAEDLDEIRAAQEAEKLTPGYYGKWARHREMPFDEVKAALTAGKPFVLRIRADGDPARKVKCNDLIKGNLDVPENEEDFVLLKSNGVPTYHFAHAVDDHLMQTTHVVRGEEWLASLPKHLQLFRYLGFRTPKYMHISQLMKLDGNSKVKLSKRDKGAALSDYRVQGYPPVSVLEYVMTLLNSNFEEWRRANPTLPYTDFPFSIKKMSPSGSLFDLDKLNDVSKNAISRMTAEDVYASVLDWAREYDADFAALLAADPVKATRILAIGRGGKKPRKDFATWTDVKPYMALFYKELFERIDSIPDTYDAATVQTVLRAFLASYDSADDSTAWFEKLKDIAESVGYARETKLYKENPEAFKGHVGDVSMFVRIAVTGKQNSPDLYEIMQILGKDEVCARVTAALA